YGNKGSTDQHAYVQQLRDGVLNFFVTFIEVRKDRQTPRFDVEPGVTAGDYLHGFLRGTRAALYEGGRESITISVPDVNAFTVGALIALYERAVGFYGSLVNVNAYHQPGVEAGKKAATEVLKLQQRVLERLPNPPGETVQQIAQKLGADPEDVYHVLRHAAVNDANVSSSNADQPATARFFRASS
ncbi:MAG: glucose-6-phosphate isomerase, partial [Chthoniobacterales bacterium]